MFWQSSCLGAVGAPNGRKGWTWAEEKANPELLLCPQTVSVCMDGADPEKPSVSGGSELCCPPPRNANSPTSKRNWKTLLLSHGCSASRSSSQSSSQRGSLSSISRSVSCSWLLPSGFPMVTSSAVLQLITSTSELESQSGRDWKSLFSDLMGESTSDLQAWPICKQRKERNFFVP